MKKTASLLLSAALTGALLAPAALAAGAPAAELSLNGTPLDTSALPAVEGIPMRLVAEADKGYASWFEEEGQGFFYLAGRRIVVDFRDGSVSVDDEALEGVTATVEAGVTFLPVSVLDHLDGVSAVEKDGRLEISTPNGTPLAKLAYAVAEAGGVAIGSNATAEELDNYGIHSDSFTQVWSFFPMMTSPDTVLIGKLADGKEAQAKADLEEYRLQQEETFSWYLSQNLPKVLGAQTVVQDGWLLFVIGEDADAAVQTFRDGVAGLE